jgi:hypothetical protein
MMTARAYCPTCGIPSSSTRTWTSKSIADVYEQLRLSLNREKLLNDNLTSVQARCTQLVEKLREYEATIVLKGWTCTVDICRVFNSEEKAHMPKCRACDAPRPL